MSTRKAPSPSTMVAISALALLLLCGLGYWAYGWFHDHYHKVESDEYQGWPGKTNAFPFLRAQATLQNLGYESTVHSRLDIATQKLANSDILLSLGHRGELNSEESNQVFEWVSNGGTLILGAMHWRHFAATDEYDPMLDDLELEVQLRTTAADTDNNTEPQQTHIENAAENVFTAVKNLSNSTPAQLQPLGSSEKLEVNFGSRYQLSDWGDEVGWYGVDNDVLYARQYGWGDGRVIVMLHGGVFSNDELDLHDHMQLLYCWVSYGGGQPRLHWHYRATVPSLWKTLWKHAALAICMAALTIAIWIWSGSRRDGPVRTLPAASRRELLEHLQASGWWLWQADNGLGLWQTAWAELQRQLQRRWPEHQQLAEQLWLDELADHSQLPEDTLQLALTQPPTVASLADKPLKKDQFLTHIRAIQQLRASL